MITKLAISICFINLVFSVKSQEIVEVVSLQDTIKETSGLLYINQKVITHNDSGGDAVLYEIDSLTGSVNRSVVVSNVSNVDWEDLANDDTFIYIADIGNNTGSRTDLSIYRVLISDFFNTPNDTIVADTIQFSYSDQIDFTPSSFSTNYDAEALLSIDDSLYIFTKNWGDNWTNIYSVSKIPGVYQITKIDSVNTQGLITGGTYNVYSNSIVLTGYTFLGAFYVELSNFSNTNFSSGQTVKKTLTLPVGASFQIEGVTTINQSQYYFTAEEQNTDYAGLYRLNTDFDLSIDQQTKLQNDLVYNSELKMISNNSLLESSISIYDLKGVLYTKTDTQTIYLGNLPNGFYVTVLKNKKGEIISYLKIILN